MFSLDHVDHTYRNRKKEALQMHCGNLGYKYCTVTQDYPSLYYYLTFLFEVNRKLWYMTILRVQGSGFVYVWMHMDGPCTALVGMHSQQQQQQQRYRTMTY